MRAKSDRAENTSYGDGDGDGDGAEPEHGVELPDGPEFLGKPAISHDEGGKDYDEKDQHRKRTSDNDHEARLSDDEVESRIEITGKATERRTIDFFL
ncbi:MAG: hypothetical protein OSB05_02105 [Akkermansiaceae bacterium]|nr:hypothetical protein [Akkermansiaceae bacterium]